jgi:hypothetical protein
VRDYEYFQTLKPIIKDKADEHQREFEHSFPEILRIGNPYDTTYRCYERVNPGKRSAVHRLLNKSLPKSLTWSPEEIKERGKEFEMNELPLHTTNIVARIARFIIAVFGGLSLVVPMLIMSINSSLTKALVTSSVATILFSAFLSFVLDSSDYETLAATATYAAVLMVFVGTSLAGT